MNGGALLPLNLLKKLDVHNVKKVQNSISLCLPCATELEYREVQRKREIDPPPVKASEPPLVKASDPPVIKKTDTIFS